MQVQGWMFAIILSSICTLGMLTIYADLATTYDTTPINESYMRTFDKVNETMGIATQMGKDLRLIPLDPEEITSTGGDVFSFIGALALGPIRLVSGTISIMYSMVVDGVGILGIPPYITDMFLFLITITVMMMIFAAFLKWKVNE